MSLRPGVNPGLCLRGEQRHGGTAAIEFRNVSYRLPDGRALLDRVTLQVATGTTVALLGKSGRGRPHCCAR